MRKLIVFITIFSLVVSFADAQGQKRKRSGFNRKKPPYKYELIGSIGATNFLGDLGGANQIGTNGVKDLELTLTNPAMGAGIRFKVASMLSAKGNLYWGIIRGNDQLTKEPFRNTRNLNFKSNIFELSGQIEFKFSREKRGHIYQIKGIRGMKHKDRDFYLFGGGGLVHFNPKGKYNDKWYTLQPLGTEGQGVLAGSKKYSRITGLLSAGGGFRLSLNRYWGVGFELGIRKTFTDYLDDVSTNYPDPSVFNGNVVAQNLSNPSKPDSPNYCYPCIGEQRGDPADKDAYIFGVFTLGYKMMFKKRSRSKF